MGPRSQHSALVTQVGKRAAVEGGDSVSLLQLVDVACARWGAGWQAPDLRHWLVRETWTRGESLVCGIRTDTHIQGSSSQTVP